MTIEARALRLAVVQDFAPHAPVLHRYVLDAIHDGIEELRESVFASIPDDKWESMIEPTMKDVACELLGNMLLGSAVGWREVTTLALERAAENRSFD